MIIKDFQKFRLFLEKDSKMYEYGCLMVYLDISNWYELLFNIDTQDLYQIENDRYGKESEPHCTILYGIHPTVSDSEVKSLFNGLRKEDIDIVSQGIDCFNNKDYDVLKVNVESNKLNELHNLCKDNLEYTSNYHDYKPHLTLAYLNKGSGQQYIDSTKSVKIDNINKIVYSKPNGEKIDIHLL
jgi:hypothetical protein